MPGMILLQKKVGGPLRGRAKVYLQDELLRGNKVPPRWAHFHCQTGY